MTGHSSASPAGARQALVADATARRAPPGLAAAVVIADGAVEFVTSGLADIRARRPVTAQTTFLWFSMTKIVTAMTVMMLANRGAVDLDAPVIEHVPEMGVPSLRGPGSLITTRHLLGHSSGLANPPPVRWVRPAGTATGAHGLPPGAAVRVTRRAAADLPAGDVPAAGLRSGREGCWMAAFGAGFDSLAASGVP